MKTHWKKLSNPDYLGAYELMGVVDELKVKITEVKRTEVKGVDGKAEQCTVAYLQNHKPMILNATNCKTIAKIYDTPFIEEWKGKEIIIIVKKVKAFGDTWDALRIKEVVPKLPDLLPNTELWTEAKKALSNGYTIQQIRTKYTLSKPNETKLMNESI